MAGSSFRLFGQLADQPPGVGRLSSRRVTGPGSRESHRRVGFQVVGSGKKWPKVERP